jgi:uncharacterized protein
MSLMSPELLELLVCPETRQAVRLADSALLTSLNAKIAGNTLQNRNGDKVTEPLEEGLLREDNRFLYPVRNGIPIMLTDEAIPLS